MQPPIRLEPSFREKVWGSTDLSPWFAAPAAKIGEVWFEARPPLPILVKFLFTTGDLSVQVHPPDRGGERGKTEMWHILRAEPGARIALGFRETLSEARLREASLSGEIVELLEWLPVSPGETYFTPAGTVHAIGAGIALCEIQQNSDVTYRLYDYGRPRELHIERSLEVAVRDRHPGAVSPRVLGPGRKLLVECPHFTTELLEIASPFTYSPEGRRSQLLIALEGGGRIAGQAFRLGEVWHVPDGAGALPIEPEGRARLLVSYNRNG